MIELERRQLGGDLVSVRIGAQMTKLIRGRDRELSGVVQARNSTSSDQMKWS